MKKRLLPALLLLLLCSFRQDMEEVQDEQSGEITYIEQGTNGGNPKNCYDKYGRPKKCDDVPAPFDSGPGLAILFVAGFTAYAWLRNSQTKKQCNESC